MIKFPGVTDEEAEQASTEFFSAYGKAMGAWAVVERNLFQWFEYATNVPQKMARALFYSGRNYTSRSDMLKAVMAVPSRLTESQLAFLKAALKRADSYYSTRNNLAHGEPAIDASPNVDMRDRHGIFDSGTELAEQLGSAVKASDLQIATSNFSALADLLFFAHPDFHGKQPDKLEGYLRQAQQLPTTALSLEPAQIPTVWKKRQKPDPR
ncbi:MAG: hypothetical protein AB7O49_04460 [Sphingomonadales bacterium]